MKSRFNGSIAALLLAAIFSVPAAQAQPAPTVATSSGLQQFLSGDLAPLDLKFSQMKSGWSRVNIERKGENAKSSEAAVRSGPDPVEQGFRRYFGKDTDALWTQGRTLNLNGNEMLMVYRAAFPDDKEIGKWFESRFTDEMKAVENNNEKFLKLVLPVVREYLDTVPLRASLININEIATLRDAEKFDFDATFTAFSDEVLRKENERAPQGQTLQNAELDLNGALSLLTFALQGYIEDHDGVLPSLDNWTAMDSALTPYFGSDVLPVEIQQKIHFNSLLSNKKLVHLEKYASSLIVFYSDPDPNGNRWVASLEGIIEEVSATEWPQRKKASRLP